MAFIDEWVPQRLLTGFVIGPQWKTTLVDMDNGLENPNADWILPKYKAIGQLGALNAAERALWRNLAMTMRGRKNAIRFLDPLDCVATAQPLIELGGVVYLARAYTIGTGPSAETAYRIIQAPQTATLSGAGSVNMNNGVVTGADPELDTWTGRYGMWMRFESDFNPTTAVTPDIHDISIELIERRRKPTE